MSAYMGVNQKVHYTLRIAVAMCFIGHGSFGIITKPAWCNYFAVFGIGHNLSYQLMPIVGCFDILLGIIVLMYPVRAIPVWLIFWGMATALLRPLSGEPFAEFIERAGNYGAPFSLLLLSGMPKNIRSLFTRIDPHTQAGAATPAVVATSLKIVVFLLLVGHGWLNIIGKAALLNQYTSLGFSNPVQVAQIIGVAEIFAAFSVIIKPSRPVILAFFIWKAGTELFYPHYAFFEWVERGGSYGVLLALWIITERRSALKHTPPGNYIMQKVFAGGGD